MAVLLNLLFNEFKGGNTKDSSVFAAGPARMVREDELTALQDGDHFESGKLIDRHGEEIPILPADSSGAHA